MSKQDARMMWRDLQQQMERLRHSKDGREWPTYIDVLLLRLIGVMLEIEDA